MPSTRSKDEELEQPIDEVECFISIRHLIREYQIKYNIPKTNLPNYSLPEPRMAEGPQNRPLKDYASLSQEEPHNSIAAPAIALNDSELKPSLLQVVQQNQIFRMSYKRSKSSFIRVCAVHRHSERKWCQP